MKAVRIALLGVMLVAALSLMGCGGGADASSAGTDGANPLVGEWVGAGGGTIEFTEDVFNTNPDSTSNAKYRYTIVDGTTMTLVRITEKNGVEFDDTANSRTEHYNLDGDTLKLESYGDGYYRPNSDALKQAQKAEQQVQDTKANADEAQLEANACGAVRAIYGMAFEDWFTDAYSDDMGTMSVVDYAYWGKVPKFGWDFSTLEQKVGGNMPTAFTDWTANMMSDQYMYKAENKQRFIDWVKAAKCPTGGTYSVKWGDTRDWPPMKVECSEHPAETSN